MKRPNNFAFHIDISNYVQTTPVRINAKVPDNRHPSRQSVAGCPCFLSNIHKMSIAEKGR